MVGAEKEEEEDISSMMYEVNVMEVKVGRFKISLPLTLLDLMKLEGYKEANPFYLPKCHQSSPI